MPTQAKCPSCGTHLSIKITAEKSIKKESYFDRQLREDQEKFNSLPQEEKEKILKEREENLRQHPHLRQYIEPSQNEELSPDGGNLH